MYLSDTDVMHNKHEFGISEYCPACGWLGWPVDKSMIDAATTVSDEPVVGHTHDVEATTIPDVQDYAEAPDIRCRFAKFIDGNLLRCGKFIPHYAHNHLGDHMVMSEDGSRIFYVKNTVPSDG